MPEVDSKLKKKTITRWIFATDDPRAITLTNGGVIPGRWRGEEWIEPRQQSPLTAYFNTYSGLCLTSDSVLAKHIQELKAFRSDINPSGNVWLVEVIEEIVSGTPIPATAPAPKRRTPTVKGTRGTGQAPFTPNISGTKKVKISG